MSLAFWLAVTALAAIAAGLVVLTVKTPGEIGR